MGGAVSISKTCGFDKAASTSVIPRITSGTQGKNKTPLPTAHSGLKRKLTMRHTVRLDTEAAQRVQTMVLEMSKTGKVELTSTSDHDEENGVIGTLTKQNLVCLRHIPEMILSMLHLTELNLRCNEISDIPKEFGELLALQVLILSRNKLSMLPENLTKLTKLRVLEIAHNDLTALPQSLGSLTAVEVLLVNNNRISSIPQSIGSCQQMRILNLYNNELTELENSISFLVQLVELNASNNRITKVPKEFLLWKNMRRLFLQVNQIALLPALDALSNLEILQVQQNELETLPSMQDLVHLTKLDANNNDITTLPADHIADMSALVYLSLRNNKLTEINSQLTQCLGLEILDLGGNPIRSPIPRGLADLSKLRTLLLDGCNITELPIELIGLTSVDRLHLGSCLRMDDPETCEVVLGLRDSCARRGGWLKTGDWTDHRTGSMPSDFWDFYATLEDRIPHEPARKSRFEGGEGSTDILAGRGKLPQRSTSP